MKVINVHKRLLKGPIEVVSELFRSLATPKDKIWPKQNWPAIRFRNGLHVGSRGGHGRIRYTIIEYKEGKSIAFSFTKPEGFLGTHELSIRSVAENTTEIVHKIEMKTTTIKAVFMWIFVIRWLHDALIEEAFDNVENQFQYSLKKTNYSVWVTLLRSAYKRKSFKTKQA